MKNTHSKLLITLISFCTIFTLISVDADLGGEFLETTETFSGEEDGPRSFIMNATANSCYKDVVIDGDDMSQACITQGWTEPELQEAIPTLFFNKVVSLNVPTGSNVCQISPEICVPVSTR